MKRVLPLVFACLSLSTAAFADARSDAIDAAANLASETADLSNYVAQTCGCQNTARSLAEISDKAGDLEMAARYGTRQQTIQGLRPIVRIAIDMRAFVKHIADPAVRLRVKRTYLIALNDTGKIIDPKWVAMKSCSVSTMSSGRCDETSQLDQIDSALDRNGAPRNYDQTPEF